MFFLDTLNQSTFQIHVSPFHYRIPNRFIYIYIYHLILHVIQEPLTNISTCLLYIMGADRWNILFQ
jgi:hypothetical protein